MDPSKCIVLYHSQYGATRTYARWIAEELLCPIADVRSFRPHTLPKYDCVIVGGGVYFGKLSVLSFLKRHMDAMAGKKVFCFGVGLGAKEKGLAEAFIQNVFTDALQKVDFFYVLGALNPSGLRGKERIVYKLMSAHLQNKDPQTLSQLQRALAHTTKTREPLDLCDKKYIMPLVERVMQLPPENNPALG